MNETTETPPLAREALDLLDARARAGEALREQGGRDAEYAPDFWMRLHRLSLEMIARKEDDTCP